MEGETLDISLILRISGVALIVLGVVLVWNPELVSNKPVPADTFSAIERRIWWGLFIGVGILFQFHHQLTPWGSTVAASIASLLFGLLVARLMGIAIDGSVAKQWINVAIEVVIMVPFIWWYLRSRA